MEREMRDGRNPYGSRGGYVVSSRERRGRRGRRGDRGMPYHNVDMRYSTHREGEMYHHPDYRGEEYQGDMRGGDMHHGRPRGGYEPVEFMGYCTGYYGEPQDHGMSDYVRRDYRRGDYGYYGRDYGYRDYGDDYGQTLSEKELEEWCKNLKEQLDEREKQMFSKESIMQKARQLGKPMEGFGEKELEVASLMIYTDYKHTIGQNLDMVVKLALDWLNDKDTAVSGAEKLAVYYDCVVLGED